MTTNRLIKLRAEMAKRGIDGFFIPRADEFQGEYVPASNNRLAWISGFTGSAGWAIVLNDSAAFFTDGRYTIQALAEVDGSAFQRFSISENQPPLTTQQPLAWLGATLKPGQVFGVSPWLHTLAEIDRLRTAVEKSGARLKLLDDNPLDAAWGTDRPAAPNAPAVVHPLEFSGIPSADKRAAVAAALKAEKCDALAITMPEDICWLLNIRGDDVPCTPFVLSYALVGADGKATWFVDTDKVSDDVRAWLGDDITVAPLADFAAALGELAQNNRVLWVDAATCPAAVGSMFADRPTQMFRQRSPIALMKACKNPTEIAGTRAAHQRDGVAVCRFLAALATQSGPAQHDEISASDLLESFRAQGLHFKGLSFDTISGAGGNGAIVHYRASEASKKPLLSGPVYLVDSGGQYLDGTTDITRTLAVDTPDDEMRDRYTRVLIGHVRLSMHRFAEGTTGDVLDAIARGPLHEINLDYSHGTGHGVGSYLSVHEGPCSISPRSTTVPLMPGMILSNEPGYYKPGAYGIRIENLVLVVDTGERDAHGARILGFETLTLAPYDRALIVNEMLSAQERQWIDAYHARVRATLLPDLQKIDPAAAAWLISATAPLQSAPAPTKPGMRS